MSLTRKLHLASTALRLGKGLNDKRQLFHLLACHGGLMPFPGGLMRCNTTVPAADVLNVRMTGADAILFVEVVMDEEYDCLRKLNFTPSVILDIGANIGLSSFYMKSLFPDVVIHGFEPSPSEHEILRTNYAGWRDCTAHRLAIGDRDVESVSFAVHPDRTGGQHLLEGEASDGWLKEEVRMRRAETLVSSGVVPVPDLVKIDVEGAEVLVLDGLGSLLREIKVVVLETHSPELHRACLERLNAAGHEVCHEVVPRVETARTLLTQRRA